VNIGCTDSILFIAVTVHGDHTGEQYSNRGLVIISAALNNVSRDIEKGKRHYNE